MFEDLALSALDLLLIMFWTAIAFIVVWGALWMRWTRHAKL